MLTIAKDRAVTDIVTSTFTLFELRGDERRNVSWMPIGRWKTRVEYSERSWLKPVVIVTMDYSKI